VVGELLEVGANGRLIVVSGSERGALYVLAHHVVAAQTLEQVGAQAFQFMLSWITGWYEFLDEPVLLARLPREQRVRAMDSVTLMSPNGHENSLKPTVEFPPARTTVELPSNSDNETSPAFLIGVGIDARRFNRDLKEICIAHFGPVGALLFEESLARWHSDAQIYEVSDACRLVEVISLEVPSGHRVRFAEETVRLIHEHTLSATSTQPQRRS
jgi:hypothetical protein